MSNQVDSNNDTIVLHFYRFLIFCHITKERQIMGEVEIIQRIEKASRYKSKSSKERQ